MWRCYSRIVREEDLIAYANRDWTAIEASKRRRWAEQKRDMTAADALRVGDALRRHAALVRPDWPTAADRQDDLAVHVRVSESLRRVDLTRRR